MWPEIKHNLATLDTFDTFYFSYFETLVEITILNY